VLQLKPFADKQQNRLYLQSTPQ